MWALGAPALLLLLLQAAGVQGQVCTVEQKVNNVPENSMEALNVVLAVVTLPDGQFVRVAKESETYFIIKNTNELFLRETPDFEETQILFAKLECMNQGSTDVVGSHTVRLLIKDINDNAPTFSQETYTENVTEDARVNTIVVPASKLQATDKDQSDVLFYELKEVTPNASKFFSLVSRTQPGLRLIQKLDYGQLARMTFTLLVRDTENENQKPSHTANATVVVDVVPADLRPPWFVPCVHNDSHICVQAQYKGIVPIDVNLPHMLSFSPGPIYAVDGDWAINEEIIYSLQNEIVDNEMFSINNLTGNLTMHKHAPNPKTFLLLVTARQKSGARYSVTQVSVEVTSNKSYASFPLNLYRGFVVLGQGAGVAVKDAADPSQPLTLRAQDTIPEYNRNFEYKITNDNNFRMEGEAVLTTSSLVAPGNYTIKVEAHNTATKSNATTMVEIQVSPEPTSAPGTMQPGSTGPSSTGTPGTGTVTVTGTVPGTETGTVTRTETVSTTESRTVTSTMTAPPGTVTTPRTVTAPGAVTTPGTVTAPGTGTVPVPGTVPGTGTMPVPGTVPGTGTVPVPGTVPGTGTVPVPGTVPGTGTVPVPGTVPGTGTVSVPGTVSGTTVTMPGTGTAPVPGTVPGTVPTPETPGTVTTPGGDVDVDGAYPEAARFSVVQMAALGGVLGALLLLALVALVVLVYKHYGHRFNCCCSRTRLKSQPNEYDNKIFVDDSEANWKEATSPVTRSAGDDEDPPAPSEPAPSGPAHLGTPEHTPTEPTALEPTKTTLSAFQESAPPTPPSSAAPSPPVLRAADSPPPVVAQAPPEGSSPQAVRSILTKERRPESGYKAVWFGEDIGAAKADVVVLNAPTVGVDDDDDGDDGHGNNDDDNDGHGNNDDDNDGHGEGDGDPGGDLDGEDDGDEDVSTSVAV